MSDDHAKRLTNPAAIALNISRRIAVSAKSCLVRGEITEERNDEIVAYVRSLVESHPDQSPEVPDDIRHDFDTPRPIFWRPGTPPLAKRIRNTY